MKEPVRHVIEAEKGEGILLTCSGVCEHSALTTCVKRVSASHTHTRPRWGKSACSSLDTNRNSRRTYTKDTQSKKWCKNKSARRTKNPSLFSKTWKNTAAHDIIEKASKSGLGFDSRDRTVAVAVPWHQKGNHKNRKKDKTTSRYSRNIRAATRNTTISLMLPDALKTVSSLAINGNHNRTTKR